MPGPLAGVRMVELAGIGPGPFAAMLLADMGADVVRIDRVADVGRPGADRDVTLRGRRSIAVDLKHAAARDVVLRLVAGADALIEGFRPGVAERLGLGPEDCTAVNERLVYGRMTGWGQTGPLAPTAGHDIGYIAITGALDNARRVDERPVPSTNLVGDLGGGALYLALGVVSAILEARTSGRGQVVDASIVDGTASLMNFLLGQRAQGGWSEPAGTNHLDTGRPYYDTYTCRDGREIAIGALEPKFYAELVQRTGIEHDAVLLANRDDPAMFADARRAWAEKFATRTRDEWAEILGDGDTCAAPVLSVEEAGAHPHLAARGVYVEPGGLLQAAPAPRFSRTVSEIDRPPAGPGAHTDEVLADLGLDAAAIAELRSAGAVA